MGFILSNASLKPSIAFKAELCPRAQGELAEKLRRASRSRADNSRCWLDEEITFDKNKNAALSLGFSYA
jgi:hypothetical protein